MKRKALVLGAPPSAWEGPWVRLGPGSWIVEPEEDYRNHVEVQVKRALRGGSEVFPLDGEYVEVSGEMVRAVIRESVKELEIQHVSVNIEQKVH